MFITVFKPTQNRLSRIEIQEQNKEHILFVIIVDNRSLMGQND